MNNQEIVAKLWNLCNVLRDDGITYHQYVTELTYLLFLKMCKEAQTEDSIPTEYRWDSLTNRDSEGGEKTHRRGGDPDGRCARILDCRIACDQP